MPESVLEPLRAYYTEYKPKKYLFEGQYDEQYSIRSAQQVFKNALEKAKINKATTNIRLRIAIFELVFNKN